MHSLYSWENKGRKGLCDYPRTHIEQTEFYYPKLGTYSPLTCPYVHEHKPKHAYPPFSIPSKKPVVSYEKGSGDRCKGKNGSMTMLYAFKCDVFHFWPARASFLLPSKVRSIFIQLLRGVQSFLFLFLFFPWVKLFLFPWVKLFLFNFYPLPTS